MHLLWQCTGGHMSDERNGLYKHVHAIMLQGLCHAVCTFFAVLGMTGNACVPQG